LKWVVAAGLLTVAAFLLAPAPPRGRFVQLAPGTVEIHQEMVLEDNIEVRGVVLGSVLRVVVDF